MAVCEEGMCWAEPLGEACDYWEAETARLRLQLGAAEDEIARLLSVLESVMNVGDRAAVLTAREGIAHRPPRG
jgi:hypothetical protein